MAKISPIESIREIVFGLEDGMVSTMGVVTGIAGGTGDTFTVILAGLVIISVESLSMAAGTYLSNKTEEEYLASASSVPLHRRLHRQSIKGVRSDALFMGLAYIAGGIIPLIPYFLFPVNFGIILSILFTIFGLFTVGLIKAKYTQTSPLKSALEMITISLSAASVGYIIGKAVSYVFPQVSASGV